MAGRFHRPLGGRHAGSGYHELYRSDHVSGFFDELARDPAFQSRRPEHDSYRVTIDDPSTFVKPWTMEFPFVATPGPVYEYACHEGNYALPDILGGARRAESEASEEIRITVSPVSLISPCAFAAPQALCRFEGLRNHRSSQACSAASSKSAALDGRTCQPVTAFPRT